MYDGEDTTGVSNLDCAENVESNPYTDKRVQFTSRVLVRECQTRVPGYFTSVYRYESLSGDFALPFRFACIFVL